MNFNVISIFPEMFKALTEFGVTGKAVQRGLARVHLVNPRDYTKDFHKTVDDRPYGGGDGMLMLSEPLALALQDLKSKDCLGQVIYLSPKGEPLQASEVESLSQLNEPLTLICGRYGGVDERVITNYVDREVSVGDFVVSGGELPAMMLVDAVIRQIPGVLGHPDSAHSESFHSGLLEAPLFTRPREFEGLRVPEVFLGGHHGKIEAARRKLALVVTAISRPELLSLTDRESLGEALKTLSKWPEEELRACGLDLCQLESLRNE